MGHVGEKCALRAVRGVDPPVLLRQPLPPNALREETDLRADAPQHLVELRIDRRDVTDEVDDAEDVVAVADREEHRATEPRGARGVAS